MVHTLHRLYLLPLLAIAAAIAFYAAFEPDPVPAPWRTTQLNAQMRLAGLIDKHRFSAPKPAVAVVIDADTAARAGGWVLSDRGHGVLKVRAEKAGAASVRIETAQTRLTVLPAGAGPARTVSAMDLIRGDAAAFAQIQGASVTIGLARTPSERAALQAQATAAAYADAGAMPTRPAWANYAEAAFAATAALIASLLAGFGRARLAFAAWAGSTALTVGAAGAAFWFRQWSFDPLLVSLFALAALGVAHGLYRVKLAGISSWLTRTMGARPPAALVRAAALNPNAVSLVARSAEVTVLAMRLRDTSDLAETYRARPDVFARVVSQVMTTAADIARAHGATVERVSGDRLIGYWNAPLEEPNHAARACDCALALLGRTQPLNDALEKHHTALGLPFTPLQIAIGVETGMAFVGQTGRESAGDFSLLGRPLERALESCERVPLYGPSILVGRETRSLTHKHFALLPVDLLAAEDGMARDKHAKVRPLFALLGNPLLRANPRFKALQEGMNTFLRVYAQGQFSIAAKLLEHCAKLPGLNERIVALYRERLAVLSAHPPARWNGTFPPTPH